MWHTQSLTSLIVFSSGQEYCCYWAYQVAPSIVKYPADWYYYRTLQTPSLHISDSPGHITKATRTNHCKSRVRSMVGVIVGRSQFPLNAQPSEYWYRILYIVSQKERIVVDDVLMRDDIGWHYLGWQYRMTIYDDNIRWQYRVTI